MTYIRTVDPSEARGLLRRLYDAAVERASKVFQIVRVQSLRPETLRASVQLYTEIMHSRKSPLSRARREMIAVVVSRANACHYWTRAHLDDLRVEVAAERDEDAKDGVTGRLEDGDVERWLSDIGDDWRRAELAAADRTMLEFVERLTLRPGDVRRIDVDALREVGFDDTGIHDVVQVVALFSYFNRLADGLGADDEPEWSSQ